MGVALSLVGLAYHPLFSSWMIRGDGTRTGYDDAGISPVFLFVLFAWLLWRRSGALHAILDRPRSGPGGAAAGSALSIASGLLLAWSYHTGAVDLLIPSLSCLILAAGWLLGGRRAARTLAFPAAFLLFAVPAPGVLLNYAIYPLQRATAQWTAWLMAVVGPAPIVSGDLLWVAGTPFEVIERCSGIASIEALTLAALVYAELSYRNGLQAAILVLAAPAIAFAVNGFRVLAIIADPSFDPEAGHALHGLVTILIGAFLLTRIDRLLFRIESRSAVSNPSTPRSSDPAAAGGGASRFRWIGLGLTLVALAAASLSIPVWHSLHTPQPLLADELPLRLGRWRGSHAPPHDQFLGSVAFSDSVDRVYRLKPVWRSVSGTEGFVSRPRGRPVSVFLASDDRLDRRASFVSAKTELPGFGWRIEARGTRSLDFGGPRVDWLLLRSRGRAELVYHWYDNVGSTAEEILRAVLAFDHSFLRRGAPGRVVRLSTPVEDRSKGRVEAEHRLDTLAKRLLGGASQIRKTRPAGPKPADSEPR